MIPAPINGEEHHTRTGQLPVRSIMEDGSYEARFSHMSPEEAGRVDFEKRVQEIRDDIASTSERYKKKLGEQRGVEASQFGVRAKFPDRHQRIAEYLATEETGMGLSSFPDEVVFLFARLDEVCPTGEDYEEGYLLALASIHEEMKRDRLKVVKRYSNDKALVGYSFVPYGGHFGTENRSPCPSLIANNARRTAELGHLATTEPNYSQFKHNQPKVRGDGNPDQPSWEIQVDLISENRRKSL